MACDVEQESLAEQAKKIFLCKGAQNELEAFNLLGGLFLELKQETDP